MIEITYIGDPDAVIISMEEVNTTSDRVSEMTQGAPVSTIAPQSEAAATQERYGCASMESSVTLADLLNSAISQSPLLRLPMELQLQIYCMVLEVKVDEFGNGRDITVADMDPRRFVWRQFSIRRTCYSIRRNRISCYCLDPKPGLVHSASIEYMKLHLGLLSVSRRIRTVTLPIFYGHNCFRLYTVKGFIPFFSDRGESARQNTRMLRIDPVFIKRYGDNRSWEKNLAYIKTNLPGLKSLFISADYFCTSAIVTNFWKACHADPPSAISNLHWLSSLVNLRGLSTFQIQFYRHEEHGRGRTCPLLEPEIENELRNYLSNQVCQPRDPGTELVKTSKSSAVTRDTSELARSSS